MDIGCDKVDIKSIWNSIKDFFVKYYGMYSDFIHSIFGKGMGDFIVYLIDIIVVILVIKLIINTTFDK